VRLIQKLLNADEDLPHGLVVVRFQIFALGLGPRREEEYRTVLG
jgi:hypothetical protein